MMHARRLSITVPFLLLAAAAPAALAPAATASEMPRRGQVGIQLAPLDEAVRAQRGIPEGVDGILVVETMDDSSASLAGIQSGDIVTRVGDAAITGPQDLNRAMDKYRAGDTLDVHIRRAGEEKTLTLTLKPRPREKHDDFEVAYGQVQSRGYRLRTLITRPKADGKCPAVLLIQGLGCFSMENQALYLPLVEDFTNNGFVTFRVDKPGCGDSEGGPCSEDDFETVVDGYRQALGALRETDGVDADNIFIFGHSMGGIIGPILAAETPVRGLAVYGTGYRTWIEYLCENSRRQALLAGTDDAEIESAIRQELAFSNELFINKKSPAQIVAERPELKAYVDEHVPDGKHIFGRHYSFFQQLHDVPLAATWQEVTANVLAVWGASDFVSSGEDHRLIADTVNRSRPGRAKYLPLEGVDHWFGEKPTPAASLLAPMQGAYSPRVAETLRNWMRECMPKPESR